MPTHASLRTQIQTLASKLAEDLLDAIRSSPLEDLVVDPNWSFSDSGVSWSLRTGTPATVTTPSAESVAAIARRTSAPRRAGRRSPVAIAAASAKLVELVAKHPAGLLAEELRKKSGLSRRALFTPLTHALESGSLKKKGEKRRTTYFASAAVTRGKFVARKRGAR